MHEQLVAKHGRNRHQHSECCVADSDPRRRVTHARHSNARPPRGKRRVRGVPALIPSPSRAKAGILADPGPVSVLGGTDVVFCVRRASYSAYPFFPAWAL